MSILMNPIGTVLIMIVPCAVIIILECIKIYRTLTADKRKRLAEEQARKDAELEELRRKVAQLEGTNPPTSEGSEEEPE